MRYYYRLDEFFRAVDERVEEGKTTPISLYEATREIDRDFRENEVSDFWPLEDRRENNDFATEKEAERVLEEQFSEAVADRVWGI